MSTIPVLTPDQLEPRWALTDDTAPDAVVEVAEEVTDRHLLPVIEADPFLTALWNDGQHAAALEFAWGRHTS